MSNSPSLRTIAEEEGVLDKDSVTKVLGMRWNFTEDILTFSKPKSLSRQENDVTKRNILRESSSVFDPLGFLGPVTVRCKLLMQKLWTGKQPWDTPLPKEVKNEWNALQKDLCEVVTSVKIPRYYFENSDKNKETSLHIRNNCLVWWSYELKTHWSAW